MTVKDLVRYLNRYDPDLEVRVSDGSDSCVTDEVGEVWYSKGDVLIGIFGTLRAGRPKEEGNSNG